MTRIIISFAIILMVSCQLKDEPYDIANHRFDTQVINKLPLYDSLCNTILRNHAAFIKNPGDNPFYQYIRRQDSLELYQIVSKQDGDKILNYFSQLGDNFIYGFDLYKDSSIKIHVRTTYLKANNLEVREKLSFVPSGANKTKRDGDYKDTVINKNWLYWVMFEKPQLF